MVDFATEVACLDLLSRLLETKGQFSRREAAQRDKGSRFRFLAIRVPVLRRVALSEFNLSQYSPDQRLRIFDYIWRKSDEYEVLSVPLLYYRSKALNIRREDFAVIRNWIDRVDDWGHCDDLAAIYSYCCHNWPNLVLPFLHQLNLASNLWAKRASIVALVHYTGKNAVYLKPEEVTPFLNPHLADREKYIASAVGWILREMHRAYPGEIEAYIAANATAISSIAIRKSGLKY